MNMQSYRINFIDKMFIFTFSIYLLFGNLIRLIKLPGFKDNILITEFFLYLVGVLFIIFNIKKAIHIFSKMKYLFLFLFIFFVYGIFLHGFENKAFMFLVRYVLMFFVSISLGYIFFKKYFDNEILFLKYILKIFMWSLLFGYLIFIFFKSSASFWAFLAIYGIDFHGDPHVGRFISVYFDPNFYSNIAVLYLLISFYLYYKTKQNLYMVYFGLIFISIILAGSRSGLATLLLVMFFMTLIFLVKTNIFKQKKFIYTTILVLVLIIAVSPILIERFDYILLRISLLLDNIEESARYKNMMMGLDIIEHNPLLGVGFGYMYKVLGNGANWLDSFLLNIIAMFGIIAGIALYAYILFVSIIKIYKNKNIFIKSMFVLLFILTIFGSQFNPILTYQFFLIPFITILSYYFFRNRGLYARISN